MKKEFKKLLAMENGYLKLSKIALLHRWQHDALGTSVDRLTISFDSPTGSVSFYSAEIEARDTEGIAKEIAQQVQAFAEKWAEEEAKRMIAGRIDGDVWGEEARA